MAAVLGYFAVSFSLAHVVVKRNPERAHRLAPYDGRITAMLAANLSRPEAGTADRQRGDQVAKLAFRQDRTASAAISALGLNAQVRGDTSSARRFFAYAERLSRRDTISQLWAIEDLVGLGDVKGALRHYDIALRVKPQLSDLLYPILTKASAEPAIRSELIRTLARKPAWAETFVNYAAGSGLNAPAAATLLVGLKRVGLNASEPAQAALITSLLSGGFFNQAWTYYTSLRPGADRRRSRDPRFALRLEAPTLFDWNAVNEGGLSTAVEGGVFDFDGPSSVGGPLLQQMQLLPPGKYRLTGRSEGVEQADDARPYWSLACRGGQELGRIDVHNSNQAGGNFAGEVTVPAGCPMQILALIARPSEGAAGLSGRIHRAALIPAY